MLSLKNKNTLIESTTDVIKHTKVCITKQCSMKKYFKNMYFYSQMLDLTFIGTFSIDNKTENIFLPYQSVKILVSRMVKNEEGQALCT